MNQRQAWVQFVKTAPDLNWKERAELRVLGFARWDKIEDMLDQAATEKGAVASTVGVPTVDWLALLMELAPIILKYFFNREVKSGVVMLLLACLIAAPANAQNYPAVGGASGLGSSGSKVASLGSSVSQVKSLGCTGSSARNFRPLRSILERAPARTAASVAVGTAVNVAANTANVVRDSVSNAYQVALASATQRAATRRKGHLMSVKATKVVR